ncbi:MAG: hypothetical protein IKK58_04615 [Clostridia bacterium]|nr:hypothetical protein [Clostridia bacterium]
MKKQGVFNKIIKRDDPEQNVVKDVAEEQEEVLASGKPGESAKAQMPPVKPSTIIVMCLFAVLIAVVYFFAPYLTQYLPFSQSVTYEVKLPEKNYEQLMTECHAIVIGKSISQRTAIGDDISTDSLVYTEHLFQVQEIIYGEPYMENSKQLITYTLGGTLTQKDHLGRPSKLEYKYTDAASMGSDTVLLFLDEHNNIISEKYGLYKKHAEGQFYDHTGKVYSVDKIKSDMEQLVAGGIK